MINMSHIENDKWLESAKEFFDGALEAGNLPLAKDIIADVFDKGFGDEARAMNIELRETPIKQFIKSPYHGIVW